MLAAQRGVAADRGAPAQGGRCRGDIAEIQRRCRGDVAEIQRRCSGDVGEIYREIYVLLSAVLRRKAIRVRVRVRVRLGSGSDLGVRG